LPAFVFIETVLLLFDFRVFAVIFPVVLLGLWALFRRDTKPERRLIGLLMVAGMLMTLMVEVVTLKGDIGRMNTVFKFYLQAWVIFGVTGAAGLVLIFDRLRIERALTVVPSESVGETLVGAPSSSWTVPLKQAWWGVFAVLVACGLLYTVFATWAKVNDRYVADSPPGLNGIDYMLGATYGENGHDVPLAPDHAAVAWIRANIQGSPVIAEANTGLYRWGDRISINTGLPTIIGWDWHTKQQYSLLPGEIIDHRIEDLKTLYNTADPNEAMKLLRRYNVSFVYVGGLERAVYDANGLSKFEAMADAGAVRKVYDSDNVQIYQVNPQANALLP
jgi:uncharacterized membrane protein